MCDTSLLSANQLDAEKRLFLKYLVETGGPELWDYDKFTSVVDNLRS